jgi:hypothetical protein
MDPNIPNLLEKYLKILRLCPKDFRIEGTAGSIEIQPFLWFLWDVFIWDVLSFAHHNGDELTHIGRVTQMNYPFWRDDDHQLWIVQLADNMMTIYDDNIIQYMIIFGWDDDDIVQVGRCGWDAQALFFFGSFHWKLFSHRNGSKNCPSPCNESLLLGIWGWTSCKFLGDSLQGSHGPFSSMIYRGIQRL